VKQHKSLSSLILMAFGLYALVEFYPFHPALFYAPVIMVALFCLTWVLIYPQTRLIDAVNARPLLFLALWFIYNLLSYLWAVDSKEVLLYALLIARYSVMFMAFDRLLRKPGLLKLAPWFLSGILLLYVLTALWELTSFHHLPSSRLYGDWHYVPTGPFYNENNLAAYMMLFTPFLLFLPKLSGKWWLGILAALITVIVLVLMTIQGARIGILVMAVFLAWFFIWRVGLRQKLILGLAVLMLGGALWLRFHKEIKLVLLVLKHQTSSIGSESGSVYMSSIKIRQQLIGETVLMAASTGFMGVGGGNYEPYMSADALLRTGWITNPHNFLMELFGNWGIIILAAFLYLYGHWIWRLLKLARASVSKERAWYLMWLSSLILFIFASILPSSIRWNYFVWIYLAAVNVAIHIPFNKIYPVTLKAETPEEEALAGI